MLSVRGALAARTTPGSTGPGPVADQLAAVQDQLDGWRDWAGGAERAAMTPPWPPSTRSARRRPLRPTAARGWLVLFGVAQFVAFGAGVAVLRDAPPRAGARHHRAGGNWIGSPRVDGIVNTVLNGAVGAVGARGRPRWSGSSRWPAAGSRWRGRHRAHRRRRTSPPSCSRTAIVRPDLGVDPERAEAGNSFPSGHATVGRVGRGGARTRAATAGAGSPRSSAPAYAALVGVATMSAGWHRPSDSVAAYLSSAAGPPRPGWRCSRSRASPPWLGSGATRPARDIRTGARWCCWRWSGSGCCWSRRHHGLTDQVAVPPELLGTQRLFIAYAGSAAGIAGAAA